MPHKKMFGVSFVTYPVLLDLHGQLRLASFLYLPQKVY